MAQVARISSEDIRSPTVPSSRGASADGHAEVEHVTAEGERRSEEFMDVEASGQNLKQKNPTNCPHAFLSPELANARRVYILHIVKTIFGILILMWLTLPAFWGALYNSAKSTGNLEAWFIDRDDSRIGHAIWEGFSNSTSGMQLGWVPVDAAAAGTNEEIINSIVQNKAWIAVVIEANATSNLAQARQNGDLTYDPKNAITVYYAQARNEVANGNYVIPLATQLLESTVVAWATSSAQRYFAQITPGDTANATAIHNLALAPQTISPGISWRIINLRPYTAPTAQAVTLVGNIFLCIFAFMITMSNTHARTLISPRLTLSSYIRVRIIIPLLAYIPLSLSYTLVSLAFGLPFGAKYSKAGGFFLAFVYFYLGMAALGLSLEAMITILTPVFTPFFLFTLIIYNVAPVLLPPELQSPFFSYGLGFPVLNLSQAVRTIFFNTQSTLGRNAGVMIGWILLSCLTVAAFTFIMQRHEHVPEVDTYDSYPKSAVVEVKEMAKK